MFALPLLFPSRFQGDGKTVLSCPCWETCHIRRHLPSVLKRGSAVWGPGGGRGWRSEEERSPQTWEDRDPKAWRCGDCKSQEERLWGAPGKADLWSPGFPGLEMIWQPSLVWGCWSPLWPHGLGQLVSEVNGAGQGPEGPPMMSFHHNPPGSLPHSSVTVEEVEGTPLTCKIEFFPAS